MAFKAEDDSGSLILKCELSEKFLYGTRYSSDTFKNMDNLVVIVEGVFFSKKYFLYQS